LILLAGLPGEPPLALVAAALEEVGANFAVIDQRRHREIELTVIPAVDQGEVGGELSVAGRVFDLSSVRGVYTRLHGDESLPDLAGLPANDPARMRHQRFVSLFTAFADICPGVVFNRSPGMSTNNAKGLQLQIIEAAGFRVPGTLMTNDPAVAREFIENLRGRQTDVIYKSASAVRSIVKAVAAADIDRLDSIRICPVQFQERVDGTDYRVHVVGDEVFATRIETTGTDYRYAHREKDGESKLTAAELPEDIARRCVELANVLGIAFAGVDLRMTPGKEWYCFEVNPSPAFSYYETNTGQPISTTVARALARM
jgi:glutathione synthase/RimK-type ligase-like ATP-grasp enzyme